MAIFSDRGSTPLISTRSSPIVTVDWWNKKQRIVYNSTILCFCFPGITLEYFVWSLFKTNGAALTFQKAKNKQNNIHYFLYVILTVIVNSLETSKML